MNPSETFALARMQDLRNPGSLEFAVFAGASPLRGFLVRRGNEIFAYVNRCPHAGQPLNRAPDGFLVGTVWRAPFRIDISSVAKPGKNRLEIRVANLWVNRLIGDAQPGAKKIAFTVTPTYRADAPLRLAGLLGPVQLMTLQSRED